MAAPPMLHVRRPQPGELVRGTRSSHLARARGCSFDEASDGCRVDAPSESHDERPVGEVLLGAGALLVETQDEVPDAGCAVEGKLPGQVLGCPEAHDLEQPTA